MQEIDARGLSCPAPVLQAKVALQAEAITHLTVIIDNEAAQQNVKRFLETEGFRTETARQGNDFRVTGTRLTNSSLHTDPPAETQIREKRILILCATDRIGYGDDELGIKLMVNFLRTLNEMGEDLWRLIFVNNGVKLTIDDSEVLQDLKAYEDRGLKILVCGTCLNHFSLLERKQVGQTTNMLDIVTAMQLADQVINI